MKFIISKAASKDIDNIWLYTYKNWSKEQADRYYDLIMNEIAFISFRPESGKDHHNGYYSSKVKSHLIFYKINHKKGEVNIIRVLHQKMDIKKRLNE